jgi:hypothetical protein
MRDNDGRRSKKTETWRRLNEMVLQSDSRDIVEEKRMRQRSEQREWLL